MFLYFIEGVCRNSLLNCHLQIQQMRYYFWAEDRSHDLDNKLFFFLCLFLVWIIFLHDLYFHNQPQEQFETLNFMYFDLYMAAKLRLLCRVINENLYLLVKKENPFPVQNQM